MLLLLLSSFKKAIIRCIFPFGTFGKNEIEEFPFNNALNSLFFMLSLGVNVQISLHYIL